MTWENILFLAGTWLVIPALLYLLYVLPGERRYARQLIEDRCQREAWQAAQPRPIPAHRVIPLEPGEELSPEQIRTMLGNGCPPARFDSEGGWR